MNKRFLDTLENALIVILLASSHLGFFFVISVCFILSGVQLTKLLIILLFLCSCGLTHLLLRWIYGVQQKGLAIRWQEKNRRKKPAEEDADGN